LTGAIPLTQGSLGHLFPGHYQTSVLLSVYSYTQVVTMTSADSHCKSCSSSNLIALNSEIFFNFYELTQSVLSTLGRWLIIIGTGKSVSLYKNHCGVSGMTANLRANDFNH
jgi:hypothetical protein